MQNNDDKPTGVFVRLPLSNEQLGKLLAPMGTLNERLLAIGTPVTGGELEVVGYSAKLANSFDKTKGEYTTFDIVPRLVSRSIHVPIGSAKEIQALVRQSDALAKLAEKDAEIARLQDALSEITELPAPAKGDRVGIAAQVIATKALKGPEA